MREAAAALSVDRDTSFRVQKITSWKELSPYASEWDRLAGSVSPSSYFISWAWASCWWDVYGDEHELFVLICRHGEAVSGIAPFYRATIKNGAGSVSRTLRFIGDGTDDVDGFGLLAADGLEARCVKAFLQWLAAHPREWDLLEMNSMPAKSVCTRELVAQVRDLGWAERLQWTPHLVVELPETWDEYLARLSRKVRQTWTRRIRQAEEKFRLQLRRCETEEDIMAGVEVAIDLHQKSRRAKGTKGKFESEKRRKFYKQISELASHDGKIDLWLLELDGVPRSARLGFHEGKTRHAVVAGMDPEFAEFGIGTIVEALVLQQCIERGDEVYDFLAGDEKYKSEAGAVMKRYTNLTVARPRTRAAIALGAEASLEKSKSWLRTRMPRTYRVIGQMKARGAR